MPIFHHDDDLPPELKALSEPLRRRAEAMGCTCRPIVNIDDSRGQITIEHDTLCPAWRHPAAGSAMN